MSDEEKKEAETKKIMVSPDTYSKIKSLVENEPQNANEEIENLKTELENVKTERDEYKEDLSILATKQLDAKVAKYNIDTTGKSDQQIIEAVRDAELAHSDTTRLTQEQLTGIPVSKQSQPIDKDLRNITSFPLDKMEFEDYEDMFSTLRKIADNPEDPRNLEAKEKIRQFYVRSRGNDNFELQGSIKDTQKVADKEMRPIERKKLRMERVKSGE
jgi:hypothetical protein